MDHAFDHPTGHAFTPNVRRVEATRPLQWLHRGWTDLRQAARLSLGFGAWIAAVGVALLVVVWEATHLAPALLGGFLLVAPFAAIAFYAISRQLEQGRAVDAGDALFAWRSNAGQIGLWGASLALALILWERTAAIVFALLYDGGTGSLGALAEGILRGEHADLVIAYFGSGALIALAVFAFGVITTPLLLDRDLDVVTAAVTSLRCCLRNPGAALLWAFLIAALTALGFATLMLGLVVIFPWLGHASWHAYRDLVE